MEWLWKYREGMGLLPHQWTLAASEGHAFTGFNGFPPGCSLAIERANWHHTLSMESAECSWYFCLNEGWKTSCTDLDVESMFHWMCQSKTTSLAVTKRPRCEMFINFHFNIQEQFYAPMFQTCLQKTKFRLALTWSQMACMTVLGNILSVPLPSASFLRCTLNMCSSFFSSSLRDWQYRTWERWIKGTEWWLVSNTWECSLWAHRLTVTSYHKSGVVRYITTPPELCLHHLLFG